MNKHTVLIVGGSGLIGQSLKSHFEQLSYNVRILSRQKKSKYYWNPKKNEFDNNALYDVDFVINLCGSSIDKRWTKNTKKEIYSSRINSTRFLIEKINSHNQKIKKYIGVSAIGFYNYGSLIKNENSKNGNHFLSQICYEWEKQTSKLNNIPFCLLRLGVVLSKKGGMLKKLLAPFSMNLGSGLGNGRQKISWVHINDVSRMIIYCIKHEKNEIFNCVSPNPVSNKEFSKSLAMILRKKKWLPNIPSFLLKIIFGEMSSMITGNLNVSSKKIEQSGFKFHFPQLNEALKNLTSKK